MKASESNEDEQVFKTNSQDSSLIVKEVADEKEAILKELEKELLKLRDPVVMASLLYRTTMERENTNRLLRSINARLDALEGRLRNLEETAGGRRPAPVVLPEIDEHILEFVKKKGVACAQEVQRAFNYRGSNAASARLNSLFERGLLEKVQAGRKVFYRLPE